MNDPHVVALVYTIEHGPSVDYREAEPRDAAIIRRAAEVAYDPAKNTPEISMSDFSYM